MPGRGIRIGTFAGIPFAIHPLWLGIVLLISWSLATAYYPDQVEGIAPGLAWALGVLSALLLFASIVAHEYGHAIVARRRGLEVEEIELWLLGGVAKMRGTARRPQDELAYALAGPGVTLIVAALFGALTLVVSKTAAPELHALVAYQAFINAAILVLNMMPAFPLDGGRVLHGLLWRAGGDVLRATRTAVSIGRTFGALLIAFGVFAALSGALGGIWFAVIGLFVMAAGQGEALHAEAVGLFGGVPARELMSSPVVSIDAGVTIEQAVRDVVLLHPHPAYPVLEDNRAIGMLTASAIERLPADRRAHVTARELTDHDPELLVSPDADLAALLDVPAFGRVLRAVVVDAQGRPLGVLSITDVERTLEAHRRLGTAQPVP